MQANRVFDIYLTSGYFLKGLISLSSIFNPFFNFVLFRAKFVLLQTIGITHKHESTKFSSLFSIKIKKEKEKNVLKTEDADY